MDINRTIEILEALASGCSPLTGEVLPKESILNEREVIRAIQIAIDHLKKSNSPSQAEIDIPKSEIQAAIRLFKDVGKTPTANSLSEFFLGTRKFKSELITSNVLYGKLRGKHTKGKLLDYFTETYFPENATLREAQKNRLYDEIDFFQKQKFNNLTEAGILQLKQKVAELGVLKTEDVPDYVQTARITHPRAYESWSARETELLEKALRYTNDLDLLSECFQRSKSSIESIGKRLLYQALHR